MSTDKAAPVSAAELKSLFAGIENAPAVLLAVSGGPDSTALLVLAARWAKSLKSKPKARPTLIAATVDHGLRKESKREAAAVAKLAKSLGVAHRILRWSGTKPSTGIQQTARQARYRLLVEAAKKAKASHILTAHTLDDQAETVVIRMARGSGITGLGAMARRSRLGELILWRPFLEVPKARLIATLKAAKISFADDPSNYDPKFTRARLRGLLPAFAKEGLDARRLAILSRRLRRADAALEAETDRVMAELAAETADKAAIEINAEKFSRLSPEIALRLLGRAIGRLGNEGPVELGKLEALFAALGSANQDTSGPEFRRTLAGALVAINKGKLLVQKAPPRRNIRPPWAPKTLTKRPGSPGPDKDRNRKAR
ncbi:MAG: tRNA lysidine(34) synthetase TilS [Pseudolabrys sp.]